MTMFIRITGCNINRPDAGSLAPYIVIADNSGRELKRTIARPAGLTAWDNQMFICNDTLNTLLLYVYYQDAYRQDQLVGIGKFDFNQIRGLPYEKINVNVPTVLQNISTGTILLEAEYNQGQIFIGESSHMDLGSAVYRPPSAVQTSLVTEHPTVIMPPAPILIQPQVITTTTAVAATGFGRDGFIPIQMTDFHPSYNLFSMWDVHSPDSYFRMVQPHLRRVIYR